MFSADFILLENRGFAVAQNFLLSLMSFESKILLSFFDKTDTNIPLLIVLSSCL